MVHDPSYFCDRLAQGAPYPFRLYGSGQPPSTPDHQRLMRRCLKAYEFEARPQCRGADRWQQKKRPLRIAVIGISLAKVSLESKRLSKGLFWR
jgi:hypothetical protein